MHLLSPLYELLERQGGCADVASLRRDYPEVNWHTLDGWAKRQTWDQAHAIAFGRLVRFGAVLARSLAYAHAAQRR
jgi:hypothetical protein